MTKVKTKVDAAKAYKAEARKQHPDLGGSTERMKTLNQAWSDFRQSPEFSKLAMQRQWSALANALVQ